MRENEESGTKNGEGIDIINQPHPILTYFASYFSFVKHYGV
jgi:hypothetical protein